MWTVFVVAGCACIVVMVCQAANRIITFIAATWNGLFQKIFMQTISKTIDAAISRGQYNAGYIDNHTLAGQFISYSMPCFFHGF